MNSLSWNDMVFSNRNQSYGAYIIRKAYPGRVTMSFGFAMITVSAILVSPMIKGMFGEEKKEVVTIIDHGPIVIDPNPRIIPPEPPIIKDVAPPKTIKFVPPRVTDKEVIDVIPEIEEVAKANVSTETSDGNVVFTQPVAELIVEPVVDPNKIHLIVEQQPEFPGGQEAMMKFIGSNLKYPSIARRMETQGVVFVSFVVGADGKIESVETIKSLSAECDQEAMRIISKFPTWKPGKQNGMAVKVKMVLPFRFRLDR